MTLDINVNEDALHGFEELIVQIMDCQHGDNSLPVAPIVEENTQESSDETRNDTGAKLRDEYLGNTGRKDTGDVFRDDYLGDQSTS